MSYLLSNTIEYLKEANQQPLYIQWIQPKKEIEGKLL